MKQRFFFLSLFLSALLVLLTNPSFGQLILNIDAAQTEVYFTGSDSGQTDPDSGSGDGIVFWTLGTIGGPAQEIGPIGPAFNVESGPGIIRPVFITALDVVDGTFGQTLNLILNFSARGAYSISGNSSPVSYSNLTVDNQAYLESLDGQNMTVLSGTGWDNVEINVIPEPASALLFGLGAAAIVLGRRQRRS